MSNAGIRSNVFNVISMILYMLMLIAIVLLLILSICVACLKGMLCLTQGGRTQELKMPIIFDLKTWNQPN